MAASYPSPLCLCKMITLLQGPASWRIFEIERFVVVCCFLLFSLLSQSYNWSSITLFQLYVGVLITTQPFFLSGLEDVEKAQTSAFGATGMFLFTFLASMGGIWYDSMYKVEPVSNGEPEAEYHALSHDTPATYGTSA
jgi:hypothetical protein